MICNHCHATFEETTAAASCCPACGKHLQSDREGISALHPTDSAVNVEERIWAPGDVILDTYEVKEVRGCGVCGIVYRVHHNEWDIDLAVNRPTPDVFRSEEQRIAIEKECGRWIQLGLHPHLVNCYFIRRIGAIPHVFAEYVDGGNLSEWISDGRLYDGADETVVSRIVDIAIQIAEGLSFVHGRGQVHQDVKPRNVMLTLDGVARVAHFGFSSAAAVTSPAAIATPDDAGCHRCSGVTSAYCSHEQALAQPLSGCTDVWSWAVSVLEMLLGRRTWTHGTQAHLAFAALEDGAITPRVAIIPQELLRIIGKCLQIAPESRPHGFTEIIARLRAAFREIKGTDYWRTSGEPPELDADCLNNKALSLLELGKCMEARAHWDQALQLDRTHFASTYNQGLYLWRAAEITDDELVRRLQRLVDQSPDKWRSQYLLARVHAERGDYDSARDLLERIERDADRRRECSSFLATIADRRSVFRPGMRFDTRHSNAVDGAYISANRRYVLSTYNHRETAIVWDATTGTRIRLLDDFYGNDAGGISHDGELVLLAHPQKGARLWSVSTGECVHTFETCRGYHASMTPDGRFAAIEDRDSAIVLWDLCKRREIRRFDLKQDTRSLHAMQLSADGQALAAAAFRRNARPGCEIRVWNDRCAELICVIEPSDLADAVEAGMRGRAGDAYEAVISSVCLSSDGSVLACVDMFNNLVSVWDTLGRRLCTLPFKVTGFLNCIALSCDGAKVVVGGKGGRLRVCATESGRCLCTIKQPDRYETVVVCLSVCETMVVTGDERGNMQAWEADLRTPTIPAPFEVCRVRSTGEVSTLDQEVKLALHEARKAAAASDVRATLQSLGAVRSRSDCARSDRVFREWANLYSHFRRRGLREAWEIRRFELADDTHDVSGDRHISTTRDGTIALVGCGSELRMFDVHKGSREHVLRYKKKGDINLYDRQGRANVHRITSDDRYAVWLSPDGVLTVWDVLSGELQSEVEIGATTAAVGPSGLQVAFSSRGMVSIYDLALRKVTYEVELVGNLNCFCGPLLIAVDYLGQIHLVDVHSGLKSTFCCYTDTGISRGPRSVNHDSRVQVVSATEDGRCMISGARDGVVRVWDSATRSCVRAIEAHSPKKEQPKTCHRDDHGMHLKDFRDDECGVNAVDVTADGRHVLSGGEDGKLRLWDVESGECILSNQFDTSIHDVAFSPDCRFAFASGNELVVMCLDWDLDE